MKQKHSNIGKVLIANRGEIARRVQAACRKLDITTVAVASEADKESLFAREADELVMIGPPAPKDSYLCIEKILNAARSTGCDAIHPGYGFLSESAEFARAVEDAGLIFIGPTSKTIGLLGSKTSAKKLARAANVPCAASSIGGLTDKELVKEAKRIGFPVLVKAVAGGGGRGMRRVRTEQELVEALPRARGEAKKFFSNEDIYLEKLIDMPRHVEVQILGDSHGNLVHLGTRDCSMQRRHQKLIEEAPAPNLAPKLRERLHQAAIAVAKEAAYSNAGTVEFLVEGDQFYFLEVNTRIQVEHPVTEAITGLDLVELQIRVARGEKLPFAQRDIEFRGHAIEFRICTEDPREDFRPVTGQIDRIGGPAFPWVREDRGVENGTVISPYYDSLVSKVVVLGRSRGEAINKSLEYLDSYVLEPLPSTIAFHKWALYNARFRCSPPDIGYVEREFSVKNVLEVEALDVERRVVLESGRGDTRPLGYLGQKARITSVNPLGAAQSGKTPGNSCEKLQFQSFDWNLVSEPGFDGVIVENVYRYQSKKFNTLYTIEVLHKRDGFFVAVPVDSAGRRAKSQSCRMSNGLNTVMDSLINDVLEMTPPTEIFAN